MNLIKISKACSDFGVCRQTLYTWNKQGKIKLIKSLTGRYFISQETYDFLLNLSKNNLKENDNL